MLPTVGALHQNADGPPDPNSSVQESLLVFFLHFLAALVRPRHQPGGGGCEEWRLSQTWMDHQKLTSVWQGEKYTTKDKGKTENREGSMIVNISVKMGQEASRDR